MNRIRWRIAAPYILLIIAFMVGLGAYLSTFFRDSYISQLEDHLTISAQALAKVVTPVWNDPAKVNAIAADWSKTLSARVTMITPTGTVIGESDANQLVMDNHLTRPEIIQALANGKGSAIRFSHTVGYDMIYTAVRLGSAEAPNGIVRVAVPLTKVYQTIDQVQRTLVWVTLLVTLIAVLIAIILAQTTSKPLEQLTSAANSMAAGTLVQEPLTTSITEVAQLVKAFNQMAVQIRQQLFSLEAERGKLAAVLNNMADGVLIIDHDGNIQLHNPAAAQLLNLPTDLINQPIAEAAHHYLPYDLWRRALATQLPQQARLEFERSMLQLVAIPLGTSLPGHILLLIQDVTQQHKVDSMRRDFISNVSHELRTPLAALKIIVETLQDGALEDTEAAHKFLANMETEVDSLSLMVMELLELSRIESGRVPLQPQPARPIEILQPARDRLILQAERAGLKLELDCPDDLPMVNADGTRVQQVLTNLIHNAIKFTLQGGKVTCGAKMIKDRVTFFVTDSGIGISADDLPRVFERFYKADRARSGGGTGLGLSICKHIVEMHNGSIWVESQPNQGSSFYFTLG